LNICEAFRGTNFLMRLRRRRVVGVGHDIVGHAIVGQHGRLCGTNFLMRLRRRRVVGVGHDIVGHAGLLWIC
jgi:hypothetical protein